MPAIMTKQQKAAGGLAWASIISLPLPRSTTSQTKSALVTNKIRHGSSHRHAPFRPPPASAALRPTLHHGARRQEKHRERRRGKPLDMKNVPKPAPVSKGVRPPPLWTRGSLSPLSKQGR